MRFFHVYNEECFLGLEKNGFLNKDTGLKIQHAFSVPATRQFNCFAAEGGRLYHLIKDGNIPFYVDRIAGGITWYGRPFDKNLIRKYAEMLGDWFLGFQLHESASNRLGDWAGVVKKMGSKGPYDLEALSNALVSTYAKTPDGTLLKALSQDPVEVYATLTYPETLAAFYEDIKAMYLRRLDETDGHILPCDSFYMATRLHHELGMKTFMPEVGCQIPQMRQQLALARGIARATGKTWGAYYECWRKDPVIGYSMPCFNTDSSNEWYLTQALHPDDFTSYGENGGSSRLLQNRIYYHALMSGADYFSEEWGLNCSYSDMQTFSLSPYGKLKKDFIDKALTLQGVKPITPFAVVLPKDYYFLEVPSIYYTYELNVNRDQYLAHDLDSTQKAYYGYIENVLKLIWVRKGAAYGNEGHVITNSRFGDVFDIVYEDTPMEAMQKYKYLIDASPDGSFARENADKGLRILDSGDMEKLESTLHKLVRDEMPCYVSDLCWLVSTDENGRRFVSIFNNEGNERSVEKGDTIDKEADRAVTLTFKDETAVSVVAESAMKCDIQKQDDKTYKIMIPAAGFVVLEY